MDSTAAILSATGAAYMTPWIPQKMGRISKRGRRKMICLVREMNRPFVAFPMEVKVFAVMG